jgi:hypothetical protein
MISDRFNVGLKATGLEVFVLLAAIRSPCLVGDFRVHNELALFR